MYRILLPLLGGLLATALAAGRPFTNTDGKTIEAEIASATATTVTLKLANGRKARVKLDTLSAADQEFVKSWAANRVPGLRVTPKLVRSNRDDERFEGYFDEGRQTQVLNMSVEVENQDARSELTESKLKYILIGRSVEDRNQYKILAAQTASLKLRSQENSTINFKTVKNSYDDAHYDKGGHKCIGYVLHVTRDSDDREVYAFGSTPILEKAIFNIVNLKTGDLTDENFIKVGGKGGGGDNGIIVVD